MPVRIYDIAKKLGIESKVVLAKAKELGITTARVPSSSLDKITAEFLESHFVPLVKPEETPAAPPPPSQVVVVATPPPAPPLEAPAPVVTELPPLVEAKAPVEAEPMPAPVIEPPPRQVGRDVSIAPPPVELPPTPPPPPAVPPPPR